MLTTMIRTIARNGGTTAVLVGALAAFALLGVPTRTVAGDTLLDVSHDPTRELYKAIGEKFTAQWESGPGKGWASTGKGWASN
jgi:ABC-type sulfate transport system substrate-binding protein